MFSDPRMFFPEKLAEQKGTHLPKTNSSPVKIGLPTPQKERLVFFQTPVFRGGVLALRSVTYSKFLPWRSHPIWSTVMFHGFTVTLWGGSFKYSLLFKTVQHVLIMCLRLPSETMNRGGWLKKNQNCINVYHPSHLCLVFFFCFFLGFLLKLLLVQQFFLH